MLLRLIALLPRVRLHPGLRGPGGRLDGEVPRFESRPDDATRRRQVRMAGGESLGYSIVSESAQDVGDLQQDDAGAAEEAVLRDGQGPGGRGREQR